MANSRANFTVSGVESENEAEMIEGELQEYQGIQMANIDHESGQIKVRYGEELISEKEIKSTVQDEGYSIK
jgi:copper chaperone CopZ